MPRNRLIPYRQDLKSKARSLRKFSTTSEVILWTHLKGKQVMGFQFHRQVPLLDYIVDFYCHELKIAIEVDGGSHTGESKQNYDQYRQARLEHYGVRFLRVSDEVVRMDVEQVVEKIRSFIVEIAGGGGLTPPCPPQGGNL